MDTQLRLNPIRSTVIGLALIGLAAVQSSYGWDGEHHLGLHSTTFADGGMLPTTMINNIPNASGQNICTAGGVAGDNESPELTWTNAPSETQSFVVIFYDVTAQFTQWQMYNIPADRTHLDENAGIPGSRVGQQSGNDYFNTASYGGPCPPTTLQPTTHKYEMTVYALDKFLPRLTAYGDFSPVGPEGLYQELIEASRHGHVLASATIVGYASAVPGDASAK